MLIARVIGNVVATCKEPHLRSYKLLVVQEEGTGQSIIVTDAVGAGIGETVIVVIEGGSSRSAINNPKAPINAAIVGIVDSIWAADKSGVLS